MGENSTIKFTESAIKCSETATVACGRLAAVELLALRFDSPGAHFEVRELVMGILAIVRGENDVAR